MHLVVVQFVDRIINEIVNKIYMENKVIDIHKKNQKRCIIALVLCFLVFFSSFLSVLLAVSSKADGIYTGMDNLRYFTYDSNIFVGLIAILCIPFQIDGLRYENYHLPRWLVNILYIATCSVTITFLLVTILILPYLGFYKTYVINASYFPHFFTPILAMITFIFINDDHEIKKNVIYYSLIPLFIYASIYLNEAFNSKNWLDHYHLNSIVPLYVTLPFIIVVYLLIAIVLRKLHNIRHKISKKEIVDYYHNSEEVAFLTIEEAIENLAKRNKRLDKGGDVMVPRRIILMIKDKYKSDKNIDELCNIYLDYYLN